MVKGVFVKKEQKEKKEKKLVTKCPEVDSSFFFRNIFLYYTNATESITNTRAMFFDSK